MNLLQHDSAAGFDAPLDLLEACHGRIAQQCATLEKLCGHLQRHGNDAAAGQAAAAICKYFRQAAPLHHEDEEENLFHLLLARLDAEHAAVGELLALLAGQHRVLDDLWARLEGELEAVAQGTSAHLSNALAEEFAARNRAHLALENDRVLPAARALLTPADLARLGQAMRARRGVA